jgi:hypothetical protein
MSITSVQLVNVDWCYLGNLGGDGKSLEERSLLGTKTGVLGWNDDRARSNGAVASRSAHLVLHKLVPDLNQVSTSEDEANIAADERQQPKHMGIIPTLVCRQFNFEAFLKNE